MAHAVVDEATLDRRAGAKVPLILCCPEAAAFAGGWRAVARAASGRGDGRGRVHRRRTRSRVVARGRAGMTEALGTALALLKDPSIPYCLVGGVDSFVDADRVVALVDDDRLVTATNKDGFKPGEAGVALLLTNRPDPDALAAWLGAAAGNEEANRGSRSPRHRRGSARGDDQGAGAGRGCPTNRWLVWRTIFPASSAISRNCCSPARAWPRDR